LVGELWYVWQREREREQMKKGKVFAPLNPFQTPENIVYMYATDFDIML